MYDKWSLEVLYSGFDDEKFQKDLKKTDALISQYQAMADNLGSEDTRTTLSKALLLTEEFNMLLNDLFGYCSLVQSTDTSNADSASYMGQLMQKVSDVTKPSTLIDKYIAKIQDLDAVIGDDPLLNEYSYYLHEIQKADKHTLHEDVEAAMKGMLDPKFEEKVIGKIEVRQTYKASGIGTIAGSYVLEGMITRNSSVRVTRDNDLIYDGPIGSLKRFKDDVKEVKAGYECGIVLEKFNDLREGDMMEAYIMVEIPR